MRTLLERDMDPGPGEVAIVDATWQGYPEWDTDSPWVAYKALHLAVPEGGAYPGVAVATRPFVGPDGPQPVRVEVWIGGTPEGLHEVHSMTLSVGRHGVEVGNVADVGTGPSSHLDLSEGDHRLAVWVDGESPSLVGRVVFILDSDPSLPD